MRLMMIVMAISTKTLRTSAAHVQLALGPANERVPMFAQVFRAVSGVLQLLDLAQKFGADRVLPKPFTPKQVLDTLEEVLAERG